ncbi:hypothetical protein [Sulfobacillus harzensis]|uniref:Uncharacterized protein n=1 Tax=Sulfobacillus harzensis TaxID=2729629 RepID=A0A7Y0L3X0_9FIRM|nr:hypothetical protein [Sulfobacillus harzensis]NMP22842.1 hypothetical protein [Sulfobacillus harzensis]
MQKFSLMLDSEQAAREVMDLLWDKWGVRGEMELVPMEGHYKLDVVSEKDLSPQQMEKLPGKRV